MSEADAHIPIDPPMIPPIGAIPQAERMFRVNWMAAIVRSPRGVPLLPADFVARQGRTVRFVDVREPDELTGALGYVPGSDWIPRERALSLAQRLERDDPVVLISRAGERAAELALALEGLGLRFVAALEGGMVGWRNLGYASTRDPAILERRDHLRETGRRASGGGHLRTDQIETHIGDPLAVRFVKMAALLLHVRQSCVDGRDDSAVIGTPGGDAGEFVLALSGLEHVLGRALDRPTIAALLHRRLDDFGRFYAHTDVHAANELIESMRADRRLDAALASISEPLEWRRFLQGPPREIREVVLGHVLEAPHVGCGHLRLMMTRPDEYDLRPGLVRDFLECYVQARWDGSVDAELVPLPGGHEEGAVVNIRLEGEVRPFRGIPLVSPSCEGTQMFVNHPQVTSYLRRELAGFLALQHDVVALPAGGLAALEREIGARADRHLGTTLGHLAAGLPVYDVEFGHDKRVRVEHVGSVPSPSAAADTSAP